MTEVEEAAYTLGQRTAWAGLLHMALKELGYEDALVERVKWVAEREAAVAALRSLCRNYGDNEWDDHLHLADVINNHLARHVELT
jgi:predicted secreted protein